MNKPERTADGSSGSWIVWIVVLVLLAMAYLGQPGGGVVATIVILLVLASVFFLMGRACTHHPQREVEQPAAPTPPADVPIDDVFAANEHHRVPLGVTFQGRLLVAPDEAARSLADRFRGRGWTPVLHEDGDGRPTLTLVPERAVVSPRRERGPALHILLLALTIVTTTWAGALHQGVNLLQEPGRFTTGLPYALALMTILGAHEMGHYVMARRHGMRVTLPYFIPVPFALGTFGAFIRLLSPSPSRRALFDVGVAGPLAGLAFAIPALLIGLPLSTTVSTDVSGPGLHLGTDAGSSILFSALASIAIPESMAAGHVIVLHPLAFAGWLGLLVTALNLIPVGQLDGGHIADAMFGQRSGATIGTVAMVTLVLLGLFVWSGLLYWAFIAFFIAGGKGLPPLNDVSALDVRRQAVGIFSFALLVAILLPVPHGLYETFGVHCPYL